MSIFKKNTEKHTEKLPMTGKVKKGFRIYCTAIMGVTQEEQKYANIFLHDIERGDVIAEDGKTLRDYITEYQFRAKDDQIHRFATIFGLDEDKLRNMMGLNLNEATINEFGRFDELKKSVDKSKAKAFFEAYEQTKLIPPKVNMKTDQLLRQFILTGGFEVDMP